MPQYWYLWLFLIISIILFVIVSQKASAAAKKRRLIMDKKIDELKREKALRDKYAVLSSELIESADLSELPDGIAAHIQRRLEKDESGDINFAFKALPLHEKNIYTLKYFIDDSQSALSEFFKRNGEPLLSLAPMALNAVGSDLSEIVADMYTMFDENNDNCSIDENKIKLLDEKFAKQLDIERLYFKIKEYIKRNY